MNAGATVIQGNRVEDGEVDRAGRWRDHDAVAGSAIAADEILDDAVVHCEACARVEDNTVVSSTGAVNLEARQYDVARAGTDGDAVALGWRSDRSPAIAIDGNWISDGQRPVFAGIKRGDNPVWIGQSIGVRECGA